MDTRHATLLIMVAILIATPFALATPPVRAANVSFMLYQGTTCPGTAFSLCFGNGKVANPTLTVNQGDVVTITVQNNDTITHTFTIITSPYTSVNIINTMGQTHMQTFTADTPGNSFTYECTQLNHASIGMMGTLKVNAVGGTPLTPVALFGILLTAMTAVYLSRRRQ